LRCWNKEVDRLLLVVGNSWDAVYSEGTAGFRFGYLCESWFLERLFGGWSAREFRTGNRGRRWTSEDVHCGLLSCRSMSSVLV
jgi:hypothetical protein